MFVNGFVLIKVLGQLCSNILSLSKLGLSVTLKKKKFSNPLFSVLSVIGHLYSLSNKPQHYHLLCSETQREFKRCT